jgi:hypothetical protein
MAYWITTPNLQLGLPLVRDGSKFELPGANIPVGVSPFSSSVCIKVSMATEKF